MSDAIARAKKIKLLLFDVDGVFTDGTIWLFPAPAGAEQHPEKAKHDGASGYGIVSASMMEAKGFSAHDGIGISLARLGGIRTGIITKRISETVALRARDLKLEFVRQGVLNKIEAFNEILAEAKLTAEQAAYMGDDIIDLPVMQAAGLAIAVPNAREEAKRAAHYVTERAGGYGAARDAIEFILRAQGLLERVVAAYVAGKRAVGK